MPCRTSPAHINNFLFGRNGKSASAGRQRLKMIRTRNDRKIKMRRTWFTICDLFDLPSLPFTMPFAAFITLSRNFRLYRALAPAIVKGTIPPEAKCQFNIFLFSPGPLSLSVSEWKRGSERKNDSEQTQKESLVAGIKIASTRSQFDF